MKRSLLFLSPSSVDVRSRLKENPGGFREPVEKRSSQQGPSFFGNTVGVSPAFQKQRDNFRVVLFHREGHRADSVFRKQVWVRPLRQQIPKDLHGVPVAMVNDAGIKLA